LYKIKVHSQKFTFRLDSPDGVSSERFFELLGEEQRNIFSKHIRVLHQVLCDFVFFAKGKLISRADFGLGILVRAGLGHFFVVACEEALVGFFLEPFKFANNRK